ncbi:MAG: LysM peptidoglycan-binding domain-containing protein [Pseudobdellovibrio sp.]
MGFSYLNRTFLICILATSMFYAGFVHAQDESSSTSSEVSPQENNEVKDSSEAPFDFKNVPQRPKKPSELNDESSSFVPSPDSLDPLPLSKESLKEDEEPILEDIKSVLKVRPKEKKVVESKEKTHGASAGLSVSKKKTVRKSSRKKTVESQRSPDDPDLALEKRLNNIYNKYNAVPTSSEVWGSVTTNVANIYTVVKGDTLFTISKVLFGDPQFWPKIWAINSMGILNPHQITPGTQIYFYPGTGTTAPSLSVGAPLSAVSQTGQVEYVRDYNSQGTEFHKMASLDGKGVPYSQIPPSFPGYKAPDITLGADGVQVDVASRAQLPEVKIKNPYILSSMKLKTDYKISEKEAEKLICKEKHYVPVVIKNNTSAAPGFYRMVVEEDYKFEKIKKTYAYKDVGQVEISADNSLRVKQCLQVVDTDVLLVTSDMLNSLPDPNEVITGTRFQILEGLDVYNQQFYYSHQYVILNTDQLPDAPNNTLKIYSKAAGETVGEVKILKRTGTLSVGYILKNNDVIRTGDQLVVP